MKINRLETHDRLEHFVKDQSQNVFKGAETCLKENPLSLALQDKSPYIYIFAHPRTADDGVTKKLYWQPRLSRPDPQSNSYLFRAISKTDTIEICWILPPHEMWDQYTKGNVTESNWALWSIKQFIHNKKNLEKVHPDDISEDRQKKILEIVLEDHKKEVLAKKMMGAIYKGNGLDLYV